MKPTTQCLAILLILDPMALASPRYWQPSPEIPKILAEIGFFRELENRECKILKDDISLKMVLANKHQITSSFALDWYKAVLKQTKSNINNANVVLCPLCVQSQLAALQLAMKDAKDIKELQTKIFNGIERSRVARAFALISRSYDSRKLKSSGFCRKQREDNWMQSDAVIRHMYTILTMPSVKCDGGSTRNRCTKYINSQYKRQIEDCFGISTIQSAERKALGDIGDLDEIFKALTCDSIKDAFNIDSAPKQTMEAMTSNIIYFSGKWQHQVRNSDLKPFYTSANEFGPPPIMTTYISMRAIMPFYAGPDVQMVLLNFIGDTHGLYLMKPSNDNMTLEHLENQLSPSQLSVWQQRLRPQDTLVHMPKFKAQANISVEDSLRGMGVNSIFDGFGHVLKQERWWAEDVPRYLTGYDTTTTLVKIDHFWHQLVIQGDEFGLQTQYGGPMGAGRRSSRKQQPNDDFSSVVQFNANRPFIFILYDFENDEILFLGRVMKRS